MTYVRNELADDGSHHLANGFLDRLALRHRVLDESDDGEEDCPTDTGPGDVTNDVTDIHCGPAATTPNADGAEYLSSQTAAHDPDHGVQQSAQAKILHQSTGDVTTDRAADKVHYQAFLVFPVR